MIHVFVKLHVCCVDIWGISSFQAGIKSRIKMRGKYFDTELDFMKISVGLCNFVRKGKFFLFFMISSAFMLHKI